MKKFKVEIVQVLSNEYVFEAENEEELNKILEDGDYPDLIQDNSTNITTNFHVLGETNE